jgi:uncharacterized protein (TIGR00159 family)
LWFFQRVAVSLGLIVTSWLMQGFTAVAALIIIIVFRNEIRSVLQAQNLKAILWGFSRKLEHTPVEIIVQSAYDLSRKRVGALIVFPAKEDLEEYVQKGTPWNGLATREMINSIFWPGNPVHDGAAVIKGSRVTEVGVILPLSHRKDLPSSYGTRHRAALGLAETSDALTVVISEESGKVAIAKDSRIEEVHDNVALAKSLRSHLGISTEPSGHNRREKLELGVAALFSVLLITGVWFSLTRGMDTLVTFEAPLEYANRKTAMEILDASANEVSLQIGGAGSLIKTIRPEQIKVRLDLTDAVVGRNAFTIGRENITLPPGLSLNRVEPQVVNVTLDVPVTRELPIQVDWAGKLPENLILESVKVDPERTLIAGGSLILKNIETVYTEKVFLENIRHSGSLTVGLALQPASLKVDPAAKDKVTVRYVIKER